MREKTLYLILILVVLFGGIFGTIYFTGNEKSIITSPNKNVNIQESDTINAAIDKVYNSVVVIQSYKNGAQISAGSGFIYRKDSKYGYILTNYHVVDGSNEVKVVTMSGETVEATILGGDNHSDTAVVRINAEAVLDVATIGDSTKSKIGDTVFTVGTPINSEYIGTVTKGILSSQTRTITVTNNSGNYMMEALQTDASINPGNSGGPLVNINGEVIGINSLKLVTEEIEGMGFAIPIEVAMSQVDKLEKGEEIKRPYIGVSLYDVTNKAMLYRNSIEIDKNLDSGVVIVNVEKSSPADESGLKSNDVIIEVDGEKIKDSAHFKFVLYKHNIGDTVKVKLNRNGKVQEIFLKLTKTLED